MEKHTKPTNEELDSNAEKALEEAEALKEKEEPKEEEEPVPSESPKEEEPEEDQEPKPSPEIDYKEKFTESSREAQILHSKNKKINEAIDKAKTIPEPTEEELTKEFPDWELLTDTEKKLAKTSLMATKRFAFLEEVTAESKDIDAWNQKIDSFIDDPKNLTDHPELEGKEAEFKIFATKPTRRGVDFEDLIPAFLYGMKKTPSKGKMFETGMGGDKGKAQPKSDKITLDQARKLRTTNYAKYTEYLKAGKIDSSI